MCFVFISHEFSCGAYQLLPNFPIHNDCWIVKFSDPYGWETWANTGIIPVCEFCFCNSLVALLGAFKVEGFK